MRIIQVSWPWWWWMNAQTVRAPGRQRRDDESDLQLGTRERASTSPFCSVMQSHYHRSAYPGQQEIISALTTSWDESELPAPEREALKHSDYPALRRHK